MDRCPRFGLNRFDARSVDAFAADVRVLQEESRIRLVVKDGAIAARRSR